MRQTAEPEAIFADHIHSLAGIYDRGFEGFGQQTGCTLSIVAESIPC